MTKLTLADVEARVQNVRETIAGADAESAHCEEDQIYRDVLAAIAAGQRGAKELAAAALKASEIEYERWYA